MFYRVERIIVFFARVFVRLRQRLLQQPRHMVRSSHPFTLLPATTHSYHYCFLCGHNVIVRATQVQDSMRWLQSLVMKSFLRKHSSLDPSGWSGSTCTTPVCSAGCRSAGNACSAPGRCDQCAAGSWTGTNCATAICATGCVHGNS